jgi:DNA-binding transcriptional regulator YiaG
MPRRAVTPFGKIVRQWREAHQLTRAAASKRLKIPVRTLEDWETGRRTPRGIARRILETKFRV